MAYSAYKKPEDFVIATGINIEVREFVKLAFNEVGIELEFKGEGANEKAYVASCKNPKFQLEIGKEVVAIDPYYFRPTEVDFLLGDSTKARTLLGWEPKHSIKDLVKEMVESDIHLFEGERLLKENGYKISSCGFK